MRKLIVSNLISVDGYASGPGGDVMALPFDKTFSDYNLELMRAADTLVSGARTYRGFVSYWPPVADDPASPRSSEPSRAATVSWSTWRSPTT
ncbi:MAG: dihydrofolate reductase family protein [Actinomycetota bacterium]|nr:dihydrofolate reductase family protein [Actinomycetota bacterium]